MNYIIILLMKPVIIILFFIFTSFSTPDNYILINDTLYKLSVKQIQDFKDEFNIKKEDIQIFLFADDECYANRIEWVNLRFNDNLILETNLRNKYQKFKVNSLEPIFLWQNKKVNISYFNSVDIKSIKPLEKDKAIKKFGCRGLFPVFTIELKPGKVKLENPTGDIFIKSH